MNVKPSYDGLWRKRLDALHAIWPHFLAGETEALHKARVASRRIREALPVVGATARPAKLKKSGRKMRALTRFLGPIREMDVELALLDEEAEKNPASKPALALVRRELASRRHALRDRLDDEPPVDDLKKLLKRLRRVGEGHRKGRGKREEDTQETAGRAALAVTLLRRAKRLKLALEDAGPLYAPERIHHVRIAAKKLRYALEIAHESGQAGAKVLVNVLKNAQRRLGDLHDRQALLKHVREVESSAEVGARLAQLTAYADTLERDCRQLHAKFVGDRDGMFACVKEVRQVLVPALTSAHLRQARVAPAPRRVRAARKA